MESKSAFSRRQFMELLGVSAAGFGLVSMAGCGGGDDAKKDEGADAPAGGGAADTNWVMAHTAVLHFCGSAKPWKPRYPYRFGVLYQHYQQLERAGRL